MGKGEGEEGQADRDPPSEFFLGGGETFFLVGLCFVFFQDVCTFVYMYALFESWVYWSRQRAHLLMQLERGMMGG